MIRDLSEMPALVHFLLGEVETEVVEYKEAKRNFDFEKLGKYFSALSNEANLRGVECGWLLFGVTNKREICGTAYRQEQRHPSVGLRSLKHEIAENLNNGLTFEEIYEFDVDGKRVVALQIPPCEFASPTTWRGIPWSRENESLVQMPRFKLEAIWGQSRPDWSKKVSFEANLDDLDPEAIRFACERYVDKYAVKQPAVKSLDEGEMLRKMGFLVHGHITNAAIVLLGRPESTVFLGGAAPRITWTLYASDGRVETYEHFDPPFILQVDKVLGKIPENLCVQLLNGYEAERKAKQERRMELTEQLSASRENEQSVDAWLDMVQDYYNLEELDRPTLVRLIQKIEVGEKRMVDGHEERDFNIYYNFIGHIDL